MSTSAFAENFPDFATNDQARVSSANILKERFGVDVGMPPTASAVETALVALMADHTAEEIASDPTSIGYAGKTDAQQAALLNQSPVDPVTGEVIGLPRWYVTVIGDVPSSPNRATEAMVVEAKE